MNQKKPKILIVDDQPANIELVKTVLRSTPAEIIGATSGKEAIELFNNQSFALVLMDVSMPGMDGPETVEQMKLSKEHKSLPVIYLTAQYEDQELLVRCLKTGAVDILPKPFNQEVFALKINNFLHLLNDRERLEGELAYEREQSEAAARRRQQFLSEMCHEIRTPLNAIVNMTYLLDADLRPDQKEGLELLQYSTASMRKLVNRILDFSRVDSGKVEFEQVGFEIRPMMDALIQSLDPGASRKGLKLESRILEDVPVLVKGDRMRLTQILANLLDNAIKFTEKGTVTVGVELSKDQPDSSELLFRVSDTGIGISPQHQKKIFETYVQANPSTSREYGGTGLGLAISRRLVELQGGHLEVQSEPGQGSTFSFKLSFLKTSRQRPRPLKHKPFEFRSLRGLKVLVAEDNLVNQKIVQKILLKWNASADLAENGKVALRKIQKNRYNLVLMDLQMPEMNGYDATCAIRKLKGHYYHNLPIIAITATAFAGEQNRMESLGMNGYLLKPFTPLELYNKISHYLK